MRQTLHWQVCLVLLTSISFASAAPPGLFQARQYNTSSKQHGQVIAEPVTAAETDFRNWKYIVVHHSATPSGSLETIHEIHTARTDSQGRPWRGIGYHFVIGNGHGMEDGKVQSTFRWREQLDGAHAGQIQFNQYGIGICFIGNFEEARPTSAQLRAASQLVQSLQEQFKINDEQILRHGDLKATACPGKLFSTEMIVAGGYSTEQEGFAAMNHAGSTP